jgi:DNA invertase Pin-like site-specific DNA recombinase
MMESRPSTHNIPELTSDEVFDYARKSNKDSKAVKSIKDQHAENMDTALMWGLPLEARNTLAEKPGHGGDEWWEGGGLSGLEEEHTSTRTRPVLTELLRGVVAGKIKCIIVWSQCRLARDVAIMEAIIKLLSRYGCLLYDRNGPVDISTPEGRQAVRQNAIAAQNVIEMARVNSPRGIRRSRNKGKAVVMSNRLGFRSVGGTSGEILHVPEEQELVRQIFRDYDSGKSPMQIARSLTEAGYRWLPDVKKPNLPLGEPTAGVYKQTIQNLLKDCRYQGRQPHEGEEHPCDAFLVDGEPVVPVDLYERVQIRLNSRKCGAGSHVKTHPLAGLMRCGLCGESLRTHNSKQTLKSGRVLHWHSWIANHLDVGRQCTHHIPTLYIADVDSYVDNTLAPLLIAELHDRICSEGAVDIKNERASLQRELSAAERRLMEELPAEWERGEIDRDLLQNMGRKVRERIKVIKDQIKTLDTQLQQQDALAASIQNLGTMTSEMRSAALRSILRWAAVIPSNAPHTRSAATGYKWQTNEDAGRVVFCTTWGTFHTAFIERKKTEEHRSRLCYLRGATPTEIIGAIADFPDPETFVSGLQRATKTMKNPPAFHEYAPGYVPNTAPPIAEFDISE